MNSAVRNPQAFSFAILILLILSAAQVVWWWWDQKSHADAFYEQMVGTYERDAELLQSYKREYSMSEELVKQFPHLQFEERISVQPEALAALEREYSSRLLQYAWESTFFLTVLLLCIAFIWRRFRLEAKARQDQEQYISLISHEFKTRLASLRLAIETIQVRNLLQPQASNIVDRSMNDLWRMEALVSKLLDTAKIESGHIQLVESAINVKSAIASLVNEEIAYAGNGEVKLHMDVPEGLILSADPVAFNTVLRNLIENAAKSVVRLDGGWVNISAAQDADLIRIDVVDNGSGFDPEESERLFERYYQTETQQEFRVGGTGLGLHIVRELMNKQNGKVKAESIGPGHGAKFSVWWPRENQEHME